MLDPKMRFVHLCWLATVGTLGGLLGVSAQAAEARSPISFETLWRTVSAVLIECGDPVSC